MKRMIALAFALTLALALAAGSARAQEFLPPGSYGSVTLTALDGATTLAGGVLRTSSREERDDEDYARDAVLFQIPLFENAPASFSAPFAFRRDSRTRVLLINSDDVNLLRVRTTFYRPNGDVIGCNEVELAPHERRSRRVQNIPLGSCP
ncbi:MAG: hypothetical protein Q8R92_10895 [Deltaproteobacteria bacterium]|nr:hypothetical protein [Deltaproteobacteria bacterium]